MIKKKLPILSYVATDPSAFGGPETYENIVNKKKYIPRYQEYIKVHQTLALEIYRKSNANLKHDEVFYHFQITSEKDESMIYDVILRFYTDHEQIIEESNLANYNIQLFANSPGFVFQFAYVYNKHGLLIHDLLDHYTELELTTPPDKSNKTHAIGYDYTVFFALYYLKLNSYLLEKVSIENNGTDISRLDFSDISTSREVYEKRSGKDILSFKNLELKAKRTAKKLEKTITSFLPSFGKHSARSSGKSAKTSKASKARKASGSTSHHRHFK